MAKTVLQREIDRLHRAEKRFLKKHFHKEPTKLDLLLADKVPEKLEATLDKAFSKAFHIIFSKGTGIIGKTFSQDKLAFDFEIDSLDLDMHGGSWQMNKFKRRAARTGTAHTIVSSVTGAALGIIGSPLPDVVIFITLLLRNIYKIAMKYGYEFDTDEDRKFILRIIAAAVQDGDELLNANKDVNQLIRTDLHSDTTVDEEIEKAAMALAHALLLMKFLQNIPVAGAIGGASDFIYMERISDYAVLKYQRRFLVDQLKSGRE